MKGILFTELLFNKTISGEKTMTRRAGKSLSVINDHPDDWCLMDMYQGYFRNMKNGDEKFLKPRYKAGEVLYIKEPYAEHYDRYFKEHFYTYKYGYDGIIPEPKWKNKLFMGEKYARHYIRITDVRIERLYDISDEDCLKEGVDKIEVNYKPHIPGYKPIYDIEYLDYTSKEADTFETPQDSLFSLFRFANNYPKKKEIENIWCFCYDYVLCDVNGREI